MTDDRGRMTDEIASGLSFLRKREAITPTG